MSAADYEGVLSKRVRIMRILVGALLAGLAVFLGVALFLRQQGNMAAPPAQLVITYFSLGFAGLMLAVHRIIPNMTVANLRRTLASEKPFHPLPPEYANSGLPDEVNCLALVYQNCLIISTAPLEGAGFFTLVAYLLEGQVVCLLAAVILWISIVWKWPSVSGILRWIADQQELIVQERATRQG
jgi:hypothetical protein